MRITVIRLCCVWVTLRGLEGRCSEGKEGGDSSSRAACSSRLASQAACIFLRLVFSCRLDCGSLKAEAPSTTWGLFKGPRMSLWSAFRFRSSSGMAGFKCERSNSSVVLKGSTRYIWARLKSSHQLRCTSPKSSGSDRKHEERAPMRDRNSLSGTR